MKNLLIVPLLLLLAACNKGTMDTYPFPRTTDTGAYIKYHISMGTHDCSPAAVKPVTGNRFNFKVKFDSSAIYKTFIAANQGDVNRLYGFSEGTGNDLNAASIGWNWNNNALHLYACTTTAGVSSSEQIATVPIGEAIACGIGIYGDQYFFSVEGKSIVLPRVTSDSLVEGYWQYPYFGVSETAPHSVYFYILDLEN